MHPNSLANLRSFPPGKSGNPRGRSSVGLAISEWLNEFYAVNEDGTPRYTRAQLEATAFDQVCDRTAGKAHVHIDVSHRRAPSLDETRPGMAEPLK